MHDDEPEGLLTIRTIAMPADLNYEGDVFGGWLVAQMDLAGGIAARWRARGRVATVAIDAMQFHKPVQMGDEVSCYCVEAKIGHTSLSYRVEVWVRRRDGGPQEKVTEGRFTYVAIGPDRKPRPIPATGCCPEA
jgi:acyl-CoA thioesterase YciA